jgi:1,4-dihydroxy-2-naphthoate octaprenyltransferase
MLMVHHYLDREADRTAEPPKVTSIVRLGLANGRRYAIGWCVVALLSAMAASAAEPRLLPLVVGYAVGLLAHLRCRPDDVESVTKNELAIIFAGIAAALSAAALLVPALSLAMVAAVALVAVEMRLAVAPAETPAA